MKRIIFLIFLMLPLIAFAKEKIEPVDIKGDQINYLHEEGKVSAKGNVKIKYKGVDLYCDEAEYDGTSNTAHVKGNIKIVKEGDIVYGEDIIYDFNANNAEMVDMKVDSPPIYGKAKKAQKLGKEKYILEQGYVTTCDLEEPHYRLVAKRVIVYPGERVVARNMIFKVGNVPIFYFPYFSLSLKDRSFPFQIYPGKNSEWGYYVLARWRYNINEEQKGKIHFDWYDKRGLGKGITHKVESNKYGEALINYYYIEDELYKLENRDKLFGQHSERKDLPEKYLDDDRYKAQFSYNWQPTPNLSIRSEFHKFSDKNFMKDFFEREYDIEPHPLSYTLIEYSLDGASLSLLAQKRANHFFTETEYLPQLEYNYYRQPLGRSNFYFESKTTFGNLAHRKSNWSEDDDEDDDFSDLDFGRALRFHSHNVLSFAKNIKWLYFNPYVGYYSTFYSKDNLGEKDVWSLAPEFGAKLSTKLYKTFDTDISLLGEYISQMRHILTPTISYSYIRNPTVSRDDLFKFDYIEELERDEKIVFALENKLQARNKERIWDFVYFSPAVEYQIKREGKGSYFDKITADFEVYPRPGISLSSNTEYDIVDRAFKEANLDLTLRDIETGNSVSFGHRYLRNESSQSTFGFTYQLTPKLQFKNYLRYEYKSGEFEEQQYALRTDLHCWWMDVGLDIDRHRNLTFWVVFKLKAFPDVHVGFDHTYDGARTSYEN